MPNGRNQKSQGGHNDVDGMNTNVSKGKVPSRHVHKKRERRCNSGGNIPTKKQNMKSLRKNMERSGVNTEWERMGQRHRQGSQEQAARAKALKALEGQLNPQIREVIRPTPHRRLLKITEYVPVSEVIVQSITIETQLSCGITQAPWKQQDAWERNK